MGEVLIMPGGGGVDLDVITADASDVAAGKVFVDRQGNPMTGVLALTGNAAVDDVLAGKTFYNTKLKEKQIGGLGFTGNAVAGDVRSGRTFYNVDPKHKQIGIMPELGARNYTPSAHNQIIGANQFLAGPQTILGDGNLNPANIKKGVTIFGVTGVWEGYVPQVGDWYYNGENPKGIIVNTGGIMENNYIQITSGNCSLRIPGELNLAAINQIIIDGFYYGGAQFNNIIGTLNGTTTSGQNKQYRGVADIESNQAFSLVIPINREGVILAAERSTNLVFNHSSMNSYNTRLTRIRTI